MNFESCCTQANRKKMTKKKTKNETQNRNLRQVYALHEQFADARANKTMEKYRQRLNYWAKEKNDCVVSSAIRQMIKLAELKRELASFHCCFRFVCSNCGIARSLHQVKQTHV